MTKARILERLVEGEGFPLDSAPYCVLGDELGIGEIDALGLVLELRETGVIARIGAAFPDDSAIGFCSVFDAEEMAPVPIAGVEITCDEAELLVLLADDLPYGERPYAELAARLQAQGIDVYEEWVMERIGSWLKSGVIVRFGAEG